LDTERDRRGEIHVILLDGVLKVNTLTEFSLFFIKQVIERAELLFSEVLNAISQIAEKGFRRRIGELEEVLQKEKAEFEVKICYIMKEYLKLSDA